ELTIRSLGWRRWCSGFSAADASSTALGCAQRLQDFAATVKCAVAPEKVRLERESLARFLSGPGEDFARMLRFDSVLSPSHPDSRWTAVSLRGETTHPILVAPCRVGPD